MRQKYQGLKKCSSCGERKPLDEFYRNRRARDGRCYTCKACDYGRIRAYQRTKKGLARSQTNRDRYNKKNSEKLMAGIAVRSAVKSGKIPKVSTMACSDCGSQAEHYHHESYDKEHWFDVTPLCAKCHKFRHNPYELTEDPTQLQLFE